MRKQIMNVSLALALITMLSYFIYTVINSANIINQLAIIISISIMCVFTIFFMFLSLNAEGNKQIYVMLASLLLTLFGGFNLLNGLGFIKLPMQDTVINFTNKEITEALKWSEKNNIAIETIYENSDSIENYHIISQDIVPGTLIKEIDKIKVTVSNGPNYDKSIIIPNMLGFDADTVLEYILKNHLSNVEVEFVFSSELKDTVIEQSISGEIKRNAEIKFVFSIGNEEEIIPFKMPDFTNKSLFYTTFYLKRYGVKYELTWDYSDKIIKDNIISQDKVKDSIVDPKNDVINLVVSKGNKINVPDLLKMSATEITNWVVNNNLKIAYTDQYDESVKIGYPITANYKKGDTIEEGTVIELIISKGQLKMENFKTAKDFRDWAIKYNIDYEEKYEFNEKYNNGEIITTSYKIGETIKNDATVIVTISNGKSIEIPNFIGKNKTNIENTCDNLGINCIFIYGDYTDNTNRDIALSQSKDSGSEVMQTSSISITLSSGIIEKVTMTNLVGKTQSQAQSECNHLKLTCNFHTENDFSNTPKNQVTSQSINNGTRINAGSTVNITLSKGPARNYQNVYLQNTWFVQNDAFASKQALLANLNTLCPGVNFNIEIRAINEGSGTIGLLHPDSPIKGAPQTYIEGNTYTIIING